jgi:hypothetical protein
MTRKGQDEIRLPKWAQTKLGVLRMNLEAANKEIAMLSGLGIDLSTTPVGWIAARRGCDALRLLPEHSRVVLRPTKDFEVEVRIRGDAVHVTSHSNVLSVCPRSSNTVDIREDKS